MFLVFLVSLSLYIFIFIFVFAFIFIVVILSSLRPFVPLGTSVCVRVSVCLLFCGHPSAHSFARGG